MSRDPLGNRMKTRYERATHLHLPGRTHVVLRVDGRAFHTYTRDLERPFDHSFMVDMIAVAKTLCREVQGARLAYCQSDEVSVVYDDLSSITAEPWFGGDLQKVVSVAASVATGRLNELRAPSYPHHGVATFDARAFPIADPVEVANYLIWRQRDAVRNSIHMTARAYLSHHECEGRTGDELQELLWTHHKVNWNDYDPRFKRGTLVTPITTSSDVTFTDAANVERVVPDVSRREWVAEPAPHLVYDHLTLRALLPTLDVVLATSSPRRENQGAPS